ncbi:hypothetical protein GE09DRAFT_1134281 [Coniochaeta sp. 2T2.1]|nr:hypothetical protein GE09DRAFT_1134281 [Coniochaeta sp. 2T2.1]
MVLLMSWEHHDLNIPDETTGKSYGVDAEIEPIARTFEKEYNYEVSKFAIPDACSARAASTMLTDLQRSVSHETLTILYYAGHGSYVKSGKGQSNSLKFSGRGRRQILLGRYLPCAAWASVRCVDHTGLLQRRKLSPGTGHCQCYARSQPQILQGSYCSVFVPWPGSQPCDSQPSNSHDECAAILSCQQWL